MNNKFKIIMLIIIFFCCSCKENEEPKAEESSIIINEILSYENSLNNDFLTYVYNNYGIESLEKVLEYCKNNNYTTSIWHEITGNSFIVLNDYYNDYYNMVENVKILENKNNINVSFVGDVSLADNFDIMPYYDSREEGIYGILSKDTVDIMQLADIMVANNEFAVTTSDDKLNKLYNFKANPTRLNIYQEMGIDLVSIANNHVYDYKKEGFLDTIKYLKEYNINYVGGGNNIEEAKKAYYYITNGYKISFISATRAEKNVVTPSATATEPGVFWAYDPQELIGTINKEKEISDYVILLIHWGKEDSAEYEEVQLTTSHEYIDAGADLIIGSHAHVLQGMEIYNNKLIAYNLGDFIFNRETKYTGILSIDINNNGNMNYKFIPCIQDNYKTSVVYDEEKEKVLDMIKNNSINVNIDDEGNIYQ